MSFRSSSFRKKKENARRSTSRPRLQSHREHRSRFDFTGSRKTQSRPIIRGVRQAAYTGRTRSVLQRSSQQSSQLLLDRWLGTARLPPFSTPTCDFIRGCILDEKPVDGDHQRAQAGSSARERCIERSRGRIVHTSRIPQTSKRDRR